MSLGLEVVLRNLQTSNLAYATKNGNFWHLAYQQANRVTESAYILLKNQDFPVENLSILSRNTVPLNVACMSSQAMSDMRDWVILHDSMTLTNFFVQLFNSYKNHMSHRLVERAVFDISSGQTRYSVESWNFISIKFDINHAKFLYIFEYWNIFCYSSKIKTLKPELWHGKTKKSYIMSD